MKENIKKDLDLEAGYEKRYIGERLKQCRIELGLTQKDIADNLPETRRGNKYNQINISALENKGILGELVWHYIKFMFRQGFNPTWIIIEDNSNISKKYSSQGIRYNNDLLERITQISTTIIEKGIALQDIVNEVKYLNKLKDKKVRTLDEKND